METRNANDAASFNALDESALDHVVAAVRERLASRRVGFLWRGRPEDLPPAPGFTWVHYANGEGPGVRYDLAAIARPELEARSLHMLVVPSGALATLAEVASGLLISPEAAMIDGALRASVPALFGTSELLPWYASADGARRQNFRAAIGSLRARGMEFPGFADAPAPGEPAAPPPKPRPQSEVFLGEGGWLAWIDIAERVRGAGAVRLGRGARLTPEAHDRLVNLKIRILEEGR